MGKATVLVSNMCEVRMEEDIAILTLENGRYNKLKSPDFIELAKLKEWMQENAPKGLIIIGAGKNFSAGADLKAIGAYADDYDTIALLLTKGKEILDYIEKLNMITVAAIGGCCYGGGLEVALSCRYRIACMGAFFAFPESKLGLLPGLGGTKRLKNVIGTNKAIQMILTGELYSAEDALGMQLIDQVVEKGTQLQAAKDYINRLCEDNDFGTHLQDIISVIESDSEQLETEVFIKYLKQKECQLR